MSCRYILLYIQSTAHQGRVCYGRVTVCIVPWHVQRGSLYLQITIKSSVIEYQDGVKYTHQIIIIIAQSTKFSLCNNHQILINSLTLPSELYQGWINYWTLWICVTNFVHVHWNTLGLFLGNYHVSYLGTKLCNNYAWVCGINMPNPSQWSYKANAIS